MSTHFIARCDKTTGEILSLIITDNDKAAIDTPAADPNFTYNELTNEQFHHLQGSPGYENNDCIHPGTHPACNLRPHRYLGGPLACHDFVVVTADQTFIDIVQGGNPPTPKQTATLTWTAPRPVRVTINGSDAGMRDNMIAVTSSVPGTFRVQIVDSAYYSDMVEITAEAPQP